MTRRSERPSVAVVGGSGVQELPLFEAAGEEVVATPYGPAEVVFGALAGTPVAFLRRHGRGHTLPPHRVNYRANVWALREVGVHRVVATAAVGGLRRDPELAPGRFVLCDQFIDFTRSRPATFFEGGEEGVAHVDATEPYCPEVRAVFLRAGVEAGLSPRPRGTYVCTEGPRFETAAEIRAYASLGGDVVGMTGCPEAALARELGLCYATVAIVTNWAAGIAEAPLSEDDVARVLRGARESLGTLLARALAAIPAERGCACASLGARPA